MPTLRRLLPLAGVLLAGALHAAPAVASTTQEAIFQDDIQVKNNPTATLALLHEMGVTRVRVAMVWDSVETKRGHYNFGVYDAIDQAAKAEGISLYFMLSGPAPSWDTGSHADRGVAAGAWEPSTRAFGAFVNAAGKRYDGKTAGLPRINFWTIWNEPNYGQSLSPQTTHGNTVLTGAALYRGLVDSAWNNLAATGHHPGSDTILIGETAPRGVSDPGDDLGIKPLSFLRALYCVDGRYQPLRGNAARAIGCPTTNAGSRGFRKANPALFSASGFAAHLYALQANPGPPNRPTNLTGGPHSDPNFADLPQLGSLEWTLDRLNRVYGSGAKFPIWNTEYGYRTKPPDKVGVNLTTQAAYINWAEYISYRAPRLRDYMQYLLVDPASGIFASGLYLPNGTPKPSLWAYRMPVFLPATSARRNHSLEVWGGSREAPLAASQTHQRQQLVVQYRRGSHGQFTTFKTITISNSRGYVDVRLTFPASGAVRLAWTPPSGPTQHSRTVNITVH